MSGNINFQDASVTYLLWTGGWDSTFRFLQLVVENRRMVQPIYIMDSERASTLTEIRTIEKIKKLTNKLFPYTTDLILPTYFYARQDVAPFAEITEKHKALRQQSWLGHQYEWLSRFAKQHGINTLELSIHVDDTAYGFLKNSLVKLSEQDQQFYTLDPAVKDTDPLSLFRPFRFPLIEWSKIQMMDHAKKTGTFDIMNQTWFCFKPIKGKPCGRCNPCKYSMNEGMKFRFTTGGIIRYKTDPLYRIYKKLRSITG